MYDRHRLGSSLSTAANHASLATLATLAALVTLATLAALATLATLVTATALLIRSAWTWVPTRVGWWENCAWRWSVWPQRTRADEAAGLEIGIA
jgi:fatty acid desaturase